MIYPKLYNNYLKSKYFFTDVGTGAERVARAGAALFGRACRATWLVQANCLPGYPAGLGQPVCPANFLPGSYPVVSGGQEGERERER